MQIYRSNLSCISNISLGGELWQVGSFVAFFGNQQSNLKAIQNYFKNVQFAQVHQVHGTNVIHSSIASHPSDLVADGHWTQDLNFGLVIKTADCMPIFVLDPKNSLCIALHAGWRGVKDSILKLAINSAIYQHQSQIADLQLFVGPHLQKNSFEIEDSIRDQILQTVSLSEDCWSSSSAGKSLVDLNLIIRRQFLEMGGRPDRVFGEPIDTKTDPQFFSYRRDSKNPGRQLSFVARVSD